MGGLAQVRSGSPQSVLTVKRPRGKSAVVEVGAAVCHHKSVLPEAFNSCRCGGPLRVPVEHVGFGSQASFRQSKSREARETESADFDDVAGDAQVILLLINRVEECLPNRDRVELLLKYEPAAGGFFRGRTAARFSLRTLLEKLFPLDTSRTVSSAARREGSKVRKVEPGDRGRSPGNHGDLRAGMSRVIVWT